MNYIRQGGKCIIFIIGGGMIIPVRPASELRCHESALPQFAVNLEEAYAIVAYKRKVVDNLAHILLLLDLLGDKGIQLLTGCEIFLLLGSGIEIVNQGCHLVLMFESIHEGVPCRLP